MPQKQTHPSPDTQPPADNPPARRAPPAGRGAHRRADGRENPEQLKQNQRELGVGSDHRTEHMKKGHRGTFP